MTSTAPRSGLLRLLFALLAGLAPILAWLRAGGAYSGAGRPTGNLRRVPGPAAAPAGEGASLELLRLVDLPGSPLTLTRRDGVLYAAMAFEGLATLDLSAPERPRLVEAVTGMLGPEDPMARVFVEVHPDPDRGRLLVMDRRRGMTIFDAADPLRPRPRWVQPGEGGYQHRPISVTRAEGRLYVSCGSGGLRALPEDFGPGESPLRLPAPVHHVRNAVFLPPRWLLASGGDDSGMVVLDISQPLAPRVLHQFQTGTGCDELLLAGPLAVMLNRYWGFSLVNVGDPENPYLEGQITIPPADCVKAIVQMDGRRLILGYEENHIQSYNISRPERPLLEYAAASPGQINAMAVNGEHLYAGIWERRQLAVYRVREPG